MLKRLLISILMLSSPLGFAKQITLSFDDGVNPATTSDAKEVNQAILTQLKTKKVKAIVYPALIKTGTDSGLELIAQWGLNGHKIGNHSEKHLNLHKDDVSLTDYINSMENADSVFSKLSGWTPRYRFPYLKEGNTVEKRDGVRNWLKEHNYQSGAVSIDASDWYYNLLYKKYSEAKDTVSLNKLRKAYIAHLLDRAKYYDQLAIKTIGRSPNHVILLHVNHINAAYTGDIIDAFKNKGWIFIDSDTAYTDPMYQEKIDVLPAGESIIWSLAKKKGIEGLRYPAEDAPYEKDNLAAYGLKITD